MALALACRRLQREGSIKENPIIHNVAAISAGIVENALLLDLRYEEDSSAMVDLNCVMTEEGKLIEIQGTGEGRPFGVDEQQKLVNLCARGIEQLIALQNQVLAEA